MAQHIHRTEAREQATLRNKIIPYCWGAGHVFMEWGGLQGEKRQGHRQGAIPQHFRPWPEGTGDWSVRWCLQGKVKNRDDVHISMYIIEKPADELVLFRLSVDLGRFGRLGLNEWWGVLGVLPKPLLGTAPGGIQREDRDWRPVKRRDAVSWPLAVAPGTGSSKSQSTWRLEGQPSPALPPVWPSCFGLEIWPLSRLSIRGLLCGPEA